MAADRVFMQLLGGLTAGMAAGSLPLILSIKLKREKLGYTLFGITMVFSLVFGFLASFPVSIIGVGIILIAIKNK